MALVIAYKELDAAGCNRCIEQQRVAKHDPVTKHDRPNDQRQLNNRIIWHIDTFKQGKFKL